MLLQKNVENDMLQSYLPRLHILTIWGSTYPSYLKKLTSLHIKAVKIIEGMSLRNLTTATPPASTLYFCVRLLIKSRR